MGFVFQSFNLIPVFTAVENVELPLLVTGIAAEEARARARWRCSTGSGSATEPAHRPNELSGGEQQRVADRPCARRPTRRSSGPTSRPATSTARWPRQVMELLRQLNEEEEQTIVLVTHDSGIGAAAGRVVRMRDGRLESDERRHAQPPALVTTG